MQYMTTAAPPPPHTLYQHCQLWHTGLASNSIYIRNLKILKCTSQIKGVLLSSTRDAICSATSYGFCDAAGGRQRWGRHHVTRSTNHFSSTLVRLYHCTTTTTTTGTRLPRADMQGGHDPVLSGACYKFWVGNKRGTLGLQFIRSLIRDNFLCNINRFY